MTVKWPSRDQYSCPAKSEIFPTKLCEFLSIWSRWQDNSCHYRGHGQDNLIRLLPGAVASLVLVGGGQDIIVPGQAISVSGQGA